MRRSTLLLLLGACTAPNAPIDAPAPDPDAPGLDVPLFDGGAADVPTPPDAGTRDAPPTADAPVPTDCGDSSVRCVDDDPGPTQEFATLMAALEGAGPGDVVLVHEGAYAGAQIDASGTADAPLTVHGLAGAIVSSDGPTGDGIRLQNVDHVVIEGLTIRGVSGRCVAARGATADAPMVGNVVRGVTCSGSGTEGFYLSQFSAGLVENNAIERTGQSGSARSHGIYLANAGSDGTTLRGNTIDMTGSPDESAGIHFNGDVSIGAEGLISDLLVAQNVVHGLHHNAFNLDGVERSRFENNLVYDTTRHGLRAYQIDGGDGPEGLVVVNNTFVVGGSGSAVRITEDRGGHVIFDNIFLIEGGEEAISLESADRAQVGPNATDTGPIVASPALFTARAADDFTLAAGSAAIGAGVTSFAGVTAPDHDLTGRPRTTPDLGAHAAP